MVMETYTSVLYAYIEQNSVLGLIPHGSWPDRDQPLVLNTVSLPVPLGSEERHHEKGFCLLTREGTV